MFEDLRIEGLWFLPGSESQVPGTLDFSPSTGIRLSLNGMLSEQDATGQSHPVIFGCTSTGKDVTLARCFTEHATLTFPGYGIARYYAMFALLGMHLTEAEAVPFSRYRVRLWNLEEFIGHTGLSLEWRDGRTVHATGMVPESPVAQVAGFRVECDYEIGNFGEPFSEVGIRQKSFLNVACQPPVPFPDFVKGPLRSIHTLLELAVDGSVPLLTLLAYPTTGEPTKDEDGQWHEPDEVHILFQQRSPLSPSERRRTGMLPFSVAALGERWEPCLRQWHHARTRFGPTFDHYFSLNRAEGMPIEHRFLSTVQALESYHRRAFPEATRESRDAFRERKRRLVAAVPKEDRRWLAETLQWSNELRLRDRMRLLWQLMSNTIRGKLGSEDEFARRVANTRNYLTHYGDSRRAGVVAGTELVDLTRQVGLVLRAVFLIELGLNVEEILATPWGNRLLAGLRS